MNHVKCFAISLDVVLFVTCFQSNNWKRWTIIDNFELALNVQQCPTKLFCIFAPETENLKLFLINFNSLHLTIYMGF